MIRTGTLIPEQLVNVEVDVKEDSFYIGYVARYTDDSEGINFTVSGSISGFSDSILKWHVEGEAESVFKRNRIGFCVLHPASAAGTPCQVTYENGEFESSVFPVLISPDQPFKKLKSITYNGVICEFEGDVFEMEDQRNWTDASFKTYCTPLSLPFPVELSQGDQVVQTLTFSATDGCHKKLARGVEFGKCRLGNLIPTGQHLADIGWIYNSKLSEDELAIARKLPRGHLRVDVTPNT